MQNTNIERRSDYGSQHPTTRAGGSATPHQTTPQTCLAAQFDQILATGSFWFAYSDSRFDPRADRHFNSRIMIMPMESFPFPWA